MTTTKTELISLVNKESGVKKATVKLILETIFGTITEQLKNGEAVRIDGFGKFVPVEKEEKDISYLRGGIPTIVPAHTEVKFKPFQSFKNYINDVEGE